MPRQNRRVKSGLNLLAESLLVLVQDASTLIFEPFVRERPRYDVRKILRSQSEVPIGNISHDDSSHTATPR